MKNRSNLIGICSLLAGIVIFTVSLTKNSAKNQNPPDEETSVKSQKKDLALRTRVTKTDRVEDWESARLAEGGIDDQDTPGYYYELKPRPFEVTQSTENFEWTAADGKSPEVMRILATNPDNLGQLADQNEWTQKRQLVYLTEKFKQQADKVFSGNAKSIKLPSFDGEELEVKVGKLVFLEEEDTAYFEGTLKDRPDVYVDATRVGDIWSIGYKKPEEKFHQDYISRRDGELIMNRLDGEAQVHALYGPEGPPKESVELLTDEVGSVEE